MIKVSNLTKIYKSKNKDKCVAIDNISFDLPEKGLVFIIGKSGSGKSTLLNMLGGLDNVTSGEVNVLGNDIHTFNERDLYSYRTSLIGFVFQDFHLLDDLTIEENINFSLKLLNVNNKERVNEVLREVDLEGYNDRYPNELSGGQKQRVAIARALVKNPNIILADEPTGNLDSNTTEQIMKLIKRISKEKLVIIVSHNLYDAYDYADRIIELSEGKILNDLIANEDYCNDIRIENNEVILPLLRKFNDEELDKLLIECRKENIKAIKQDNSKFIKYNKILNFNKKEKLLKTMLSLKENLKFSFFFGKKRILNFIMSSLMAAMIVVVLALAQSIAYFDESKLIADEIAKTDGIYGVRKNIDSSLGESHLKNIGDNDLAKFNKDNVDAYKLYAETIWIVDNAPVSVLNVPKASSSLFINETFGTLVTTKEYCKKILGVDELEIYTGNVEYKEEGTYITDFVADSMIYHGVYSNSNAILGSRKQGIYCYGYINGIIKTNYRDKYGKIIKEIAKLDNLSEMNEEMIKFYDYLTQALAIGYSFEENFVEAQAISDYAKNVVYTHKNSIDGIDTTNIITWADKGSIYGYNLVGNEVYLDYITYNELFGTNYDKTTLNTFVPHEVVFTSSTYEDENKVNEKVLIKGLIVKRGAKLQLSDELFTKCRKSSMVCYGLYFDGDIYNVIEEVSDNDYITNSIKMSAVHTMSKAVSVFVNFFDLLLAILIASCAFILISFGRKNIKSNMYEIGVMKALGCKYQNLVLIFGLHTILIVIITSLLSISGFYLFADLANTILVESLVKLAPGFVIFDLGFISFDLNLILLDTLVIALVSIFATIIPMTLLKNIKPISIIKAKE